VEKIGIVVISETKKKNKVSKELENYIMYQYIFITFWFDIQCS
jgi:predicted glycosyltransferase